MIEATAHRLRWGDRRVRDAELGGSGMAAEAEVERTYGNWRRPRPPGLWHLGLISSVLLIVGLIASIIVIALVAPLVAPFVCPLA